MKQKQLNNTLKQFFNLLERLRQIKLKEAEKLELVIQQKYGEAYVIRQEIIVMEQDYTNELDRLKKSLEVGTFDEIIVKLKQEIDKL